MRAPRWPAPANCRWNSPTASPSPPPRIPTAARWTGAATSACPAALPQARFWTLTVADSQGRLIENAAERTGFTSAEVVWNRDGTLDVPLGPRARPGNWLPTGARDRIVLTLRLYDTPVGLANRTSDAPDMPRLLVEHCPWERGS